MPRSIKKEFPEIFIDWHPLLNRGINPSNERRKSRKLYWWRCHNKKCGHNWKATLYSRIYLKKGCPQCEKRKSGKIVKDTFEIKPKFDEIRAIQDSFLPLIDIFMNSKETLSKRIKTAILARRKIEDLKKIEMHLRKSIIDYKKETLTKRKQKNDRKNFTGRSTVQS